MNIVHVLAAIAGLGVLMIIHESGHYFAARAFGMRVIKFSLGMAPILWRFHRVHHADLDLDATSGVRFHPVEILLSMGLKVMVVILLGVAAEAVLIFEILLNATSVFNHANVRIPVLWDKALRWFIVTPDMHRVHHSIRRDETDSNYGFNLSWWDRVFGTYRAQPRDPHEHLILGVPELRTASETVPLVTMLAMPLRSSTEGTATTTDDEDQTDIPHEHGD